MRPAARPAALRLPRGRRLDFERVRLMAVINATPDSFSDGGAWAAPDAAIARALAQVDAGADMVDVGGESTRPGSAPVPAAEQLRRVAPVIEGIRARSGVVLSIDTTSATVAAECLDRGADLVNDVSAFRWDPRMLPLLAERGVPAVAMHTSGRPDVMQRAPSYRDVVAEVVGHLAERLRACAAAGVAPEQIVVDPGLGFGKRVHHNLLLLRDLGCVVALGRAVLVGSSRKAFLGAVTGRPVGDRDRATAASCAAAVLAGAHVLRVHDVAAVRDAVLVAEAIARGASADDE